MSGNISNYKEVYKNINYMSRKISNYDAEKHIIKKIKKKIKKNRRYQLKACLG